MAASGCGRNDPDPGYPGEARATMPRRGARPAPAEASSRRLTALLVDLDGHRHHDGRGRIMTLDQLDAVDLVGPLRLDGQVADLLAAEPERQLRAGDVHR